ncbi:MAG: precorrin-2 C(20)-methyltransferase [Ruminococcaceae bacterium]|jgi:precorrin-2/cobalt-factor-2 C20-methyltransferase|nr:precorrin-2 C(20)-methyltransferase [Oscillospiraceae bacterium]
MDTGTLYSIGVGPGDPELMTRKALRLIEYCPCVAAPRTERGGSTALEIAAQAADLTDKEVLYLDLPMQGGAEAWAESHCRCADILAKQLRQGRDVALLTLGDASLYATSSYLAELLRGEFPVKVVPGVPSFCAAAAALGRPLTAGKEQLHVIPVHGGWVDALDLPGTKVLMKAGRRLDGLREALAGRSADAWVAENCGMADEHLAPLAEMPAETGYFTTVLVWDRSGR